jgi:hypothetical protein
MAWAGWVLAAALALAWHAFWGLWLRAAPPPAPLRAPVVPEVTYAPIQAAPESGGPALADARTLWSPVLFSLPTPMGFSRSALARRIGSQPPLAVPGDTAIFLERPAPSDERVIRVGESVEALMRESPDRFAFHVPDVPALTPTAVSTGETVRVELLGGLAGRRFVRMDLPDEPRVRGDTAWEAGAYLEVDGEGRVVHVLLENPSESAKLNGMLVRSMRGWRMESAGRPHSGRVTLRYPGPARLAAQPGSPGAP